MSLEVGAIVEGKITGITKFGAFVSLPDGKSGLVHISEVANTFVSDINNHVQIGQEVKVKLLSISPEGKINLSIKKAEESSVQGKTSYKKPVRELQNHKPAQEPEYVPERQVVAGPSDDKDFESRLKKFMQESDSKIADNPIYSDRPRKSRRR